MAKRPFKTVREMVAELTAKGHNVRTVNPKNGGWRIVEIDGKKFPHASSEGNKQARRMTGSALPKGIREAVSKRVKLNKIVKQKIKEARGRPLTEFQKKQLKQLNKLIEKTNKHIQAEYGEKGGKPLISDQARRLKKEYGSWREAVKRIKQNIKVMAHIDPAGGAGIAEQLRIMGFEDLYDLIKNNQGNISRDLTRNLWQLIYSDPKSGKSNMTDDDKHDLAKQLIEDDLEYTKVFMKEIGL